MVTREDDSKRVMARTRSLLVLSGMVLWDGARLPACLPACLRR